MSDTLLCQPETVLVLKPTESKDMMMDNLVSRFLTKLNNKDMLFEQLPIRKIDGLKVDVFIKSYQYCSDLKVYILIEDIMSEIICAHEDCPDHDYRQYYRKEFLMKTINHDELKRILSEILLILQNLKFSKLHGSLYEQGKQILDQTPLTWKRLLNADHIEWSVNECCVCMDDTLSSSICGHNLCRYCFQKLKKLKCPVCRQSLSFDDSDT